MFSLKDRDSRAHQIENLHYCLVNVAFAWPKDQDKPLPDDIGEELYKVLTNPARFQRPWNIAVVVGQEYRNANEEVSQRNSRANVYNASPDQVANALRIQCLAPRQPLQSNIADILGIQPRDKDFSNENTPHTNKIRSTLAVSEWLQMNTDFVGSALFIQKRAVETYITISSKEILPLRLLDAAPGETLVAQPWSKSYKIA